VVAEREALEMPEEVDAEVRERPFADPAREIGLGAREDERRDARDEERDHDHRQTLEIARLDALVDGELRGGRRKERDARVRDERDDRQGRAAGVRPRQTKQYPQAAARLPPRP